MTTRLQKNAKPDNLLINMGPSHPAMHGTIRIMLELENELVINSELEVGYLHRGFEKSCENHTYNQIIPYTDRLNYLSAITNNVAFVKTVEEMRKRKEEVRAQAQAADKAAAQRAKDAATT